MHPKRLLICDYVPLSNKGEEAIVRGIEDILNIKDIEIGLFDKVDNPERKGNILIFPLDWVFTDWGKYTNKFYRRISKYLYKKKQNLGLYGKLNNLISTKKGNFKIMNDFFMTSDYIIAGHDGVFSNDHAVIIKSISNLGKRIGVVGSGSNSIFPFSNPDFEKLYRDAVASSDFFTLRDKTSYEGLIEIGCDKESLYLGPDPAFAMIKSSQADVSRFLEGKTWYKSARAENKKIIGVSVTNKSIMTSFFSNNSNEAQDMHISYLSSTFDNLVNSNNFFLVFLPHSIEPGSRNDLETAEKVFSRMVNKKCAHVMKSDLSARMFKGIMGELPFVIGQRRHVLIGTFSAPTPFAGLIHSKDINTIDIIGEMCQSKESLLFMDEKTPFQASERIIELFENRAEQLKIQKRINKIFTSQFKEISRMVHGF